MLSSDFGGSRNRTSAEPIDLTKERPSVTDSKQRKGQGQREGRADLWIREGGIPVIGESS
jgi:hypothetical protein